MGATVRLKLSNFDQCTEFEEAIKKNIAGKKLSSEVDVVENGFPSEVDDYLAIIDEEFNRLKFNTDHWKIINFNEDFKLSPTYPKYHIVLKELSKEDLTKISLFRRKGRFPTITYRSPKTGSILLRCGQPLIGNNSVRCVEDENYLQNIMNRSKSQAKKMVIFDARTEESAFLNYSKGGGTETNYEMVEHRYLNMPNMILVRDFFGIWRDNIFQNESEVSLRKSDWIEYISRVLEISKEISHLLCCQGKDVLFHCSDGWDRTPQVVATTKILMDPFYRTNKGFKVLVEQEWRQMGHKFGERCATGGNSVTQEYSPIFIQWLDVIYQLLYQFPQQFEFNAEILVKLAIHVYTEMFWNFDGNSMLERCTKYETIIDIWSYLSSSDMKHLQNDNFEPTIDILEPSHLIDDMQIWRELYQNDFERF